MSVVELSAEQRRAVLAPGHLQVRASAGSGKTEVLARRFVALVAGDVAGLAPVMPDRIAAVTFTKKAAFDMKCRIGRVFDARLQAAREDAACERTLLDHLIKARRRLPLARVSTIHSFCARMLRENPLEARLDPDFEVLEEYESRTLTERCCEELLLEALRNRNPAAIRLIEARGLHGHELRPGAVPLLVKLLNELHRLGKDCDWLETTTRLIGEELELDAHSFICEKSKLISLVETIANTKVSAKSADSAAKLAELSAAWKDWLRASLERSTRDSSPELLAVWGRLCELLPSGRSGALNENVVRLRELVGLNKSGIGLTGSLVGLYGAYRARGHALAVAQLLQAIASGISGRKKIENVVTLDEILALTLGLLRSHPDVARRYRADLDALLVDEFQDTDRIQDAIVAALTEGGLGNDHSIQLFIVGDEKQSIYGFRGADVTVFNRAREPKCETLTLNENRRSVPNLIRFANLVCESIMGPADERDEDFNTTWNKSHELRPIRISIDEPSVELMLSGAAGAGKSARRIVEANAIATRCSRLIEDGASTIETPSGQCRPILYSDIAIVMRSMVDVGIYQRALAAAGVPNYVVKGRGFFDSQEIRDVISLLEAVDDSDNTIALAAALRSPLFGLSDRCLFALVAPKSSGEVRDLGTLFADESNQFDWLGSERDTALRALSTLRELRDLRGRVSLVEVLERVLDLTNFEVVLAGQTAGRQMVANLRKLIEIAREFDRRGYFGFRDFVRHLGSLVTTEPLEPQAQILGEAENVVRLMTIHQAKGLEFPVVFLPDIGRQTPNAENDYLISDQRGLLLRDTVGSGQLEIPNHLLAEEIARRKRRGQAEAARLLYVAITRARDWLVVSDLAEKGGWAKQLRKIVHAKVLDNFIAGGFETQQVTCGAARLLLRRIESPTAQRPVATTADARHAVEPGAVLARRLSYGQVAPSELVISPTALAEFAACPRRYRWRYQLNIPTGVEAGSPAGSRPDPSQSVIAGAVAHSILERIDLKAGTSDLESQVDELLKDQGLVADLRPREVLSIRRDLAAYLKLRDPAERAIGNELPFFIRLSDPILTLYLRGQIDALVSTNSGPRVRDYKYSAYRAEKLSTYKLQLECYALAASQALAADVTCELVFLKNQTRVVPIEVGSKAYLEEHLLAVGHELAAAIQRDKFEKKPDSRKRCCQIGCGYVSRCWQGGDRSDTGGGSPW
ncbi:MAG TPA: UvrD-helicase domain-containing protein [Candidatus Binataceae bacterium]